MNTALVDFCAEFQTRFACAATAHEITVKVWSIDRWSGDSFDHDVDLLLLAFSPRINRFRRLLQLREQTDLPVIVLADYPDPVDSVLALELGADNYLPQSCEPRVLIAHIQALLRTRRPGSDVSSDLLGIDGVALDLGLREAYIDGARVDLTSTEFGVLRILMESAGRAVSRDEVRRRLTKGEDEGPEHSLDVHIGHLRNKLGERCHRIKTPRGAGYQLLFVNTA